MEKAVMVDSLFCEMMSDNLSDAPVDVKVFQFFCNRIQES